MQNGISSQLVGHGRHDEAAACVAARVLREAVHFAEILRQLPGAVGLRVVEREQQRAVADAGRRREQRSIVGVFAQREGRLRCRDVAPVDDVGRARRREVALVGEIGALAVTHLFDQLGDEEVDVGVTLAVRVRRHVDGDAVHAHREVGAVVQVEAAQEVLVRLAVAAVLRDDQPRHHLEHLAWPQHRSPLELDRGHDALARGARFTHQPDARRSHDDFLERRRGRNARPPAGGGKCQRHDGAESGRVRIALAHSVDHHDPPLVAVRRHSRQRAM